MVENKGIKHIAVFAFVLLTTLSLTSPTHAWNRIITLNPMISEWTAEILGKDKSLQKIVGVSEYSNYPEYMKKVSSVGPYPQLQSEKILSLHPDLVIASSEYNRADQLEQLKKLKLNVVTLPKENFDKMGEWILALGKILNEDTRAKEVLKEWNESISELKVIPKKKKVFFQIQLQPLITVGADSFLNDAFEKIGYQNIFRGLAQSYPKVSKEAVLERNPEEVLVFEMVKDPNDLKRAQETWKSTKIRVINGDDFSRCSMRLLKGMKEMQLHE